MQDDAVCKDDIVHGCYAGNMIYRHVIYKISNLVELKIIKMPIYLSLAARRVITRCCSLSRVPSLYTHLSLSLFLALSLPLSLSLVDDSDFHAVYCACVTAMTKYDSMTNINNHAGG